MLFSSWPQRLLFNRLNPLRGVSYRFGRVSVPGNLLIIKRVAFSLSRSRRVPSGQHRKPVLTWYNVKMKRSRVICFLVAAVCAVSVVVLLQKFNESNRTNSQNRTQAHNAPPSLLAAKSIVEADPDQPVFVRGVLEGAACDANLPDSLDFHVEILVKSRLVVAPVANHNTIEQKNRQPTGPSKQYTQEEAFITLDQAMGKAALNNHRESLSEVPFGPDDKDGRLAKLSKLAECSKEAGELAVVKDAKTYRCEQSFVNIETMREPLSLSAEQLESLMASCGFGDEEYKQEGNVVIWGGAAMVSFKHLPRERVVSVFGALDQEQLVPFASPGVESVYHVFSSPPSEVMASAQDSQATLPESQKNKDWLRNLIVMFLVVGTLSFVAGTL
jgi:hypothetical protein